MYKYLNLIIILAVLAPIVASADTATIEATYDAGVMESNPSTNYGSDDEIWTGYDSGWNISYVEFNISPFLGFTLNSASLKMYCTDISGTPSSTHIVSRVSESWDEGTINYNNKPSNDNSIIAAFGIPTLYDFTAWDVTSLVETWFNESFSNNGFDIRPNTTDNGTVSFYSKDYGNYNYRPVLELDYTPIGIESTSLGSIKAAFK